MIAALTSLVVFAALAQDAPVRFQGWPEADRPELEKLAKKAKKNGTNYTLTGEAFETRLPTREAAAEFFLYFERLAADVRPLWGTRENTVRLVSIGVLPPDATWPSRARGKKIAYDQKYSKHDPARPMPTQIISIELWLAPELSADQLTTASLEPMDMTTVGLVALTTRLTGRNRAPPWFEAAIHRRFGSWRPDRTPAKPTAPAAAAKPDPKEDAPQPKLSAAAIERLRTNDAVEILVTVFENPSADPPAKSDPSDYAIHNSFVDFMMEHKRGREAFAKICECLSRGMPIEFGKSEIGRLVPHWQKWAGLETPVAK